MQKREKTFSFSVELTALGYLKFRPWFGLQFQVKLEFHPGKTCLRLKLSPSITKVTSVNDAILEEFTLTVKSADKLLPEFGLT